MYYCEYLSRINSISIIIELETAFRLVQKISFRNDKQLELVTDGTEHIINLPIAIKSIDHAIIQVLKYQEGCLNLRIESRKEAENCHNVILEKTEPFIDSSGSTIDKWSCKDLKNKTVHTGSNHKFSFECVFCSCSIVDSNKYSRFMDLPSELWLEMMDFWHCHKPNISGADNHSKKYEKLSPSSDEVIIGSYYLLLKTNGMLINEGQRAECQNCSKQLGEIEQDEVAKIFKWNLRLRLGDLVEVYEPFVYVYHLLVERVNSSATRKFKIYSDQGSKSMFLWVMNVGVNVSTSYSVLGSSIKVLYYFESEKSENEEDNKSAPGGPEAEKEEDKIEEKSVESTKLDLVIFESLVEELNRVYSSLPKTCRHMVLSRGLKMKRFRVSYLKSF